MKRVMLIASLAVALAMPFAITSCAGGNSKMTKSRTDIDAAVRANVAHDCGCGECAAHGCEPCRGANCYLCITNALVKTDCGCGQCSDKGCSLCGKEKGRYCGCDTCNFHIEPLARAKQAGKPLNLASVVEDTAAKDCGCGQCAAKGCNPCHGKFCYYCIAKALMQMDCGCGHCDGKGCSACGAGCDVCKFHLAPLKDDTSNK